MKSNEPNQATQRAGLAAVGGAATPGDDAKALRRGQLSGPVLALDSITLTASLGGTPVAALRDITLSVGRGEVLGVVGESGAGKSMMARLISGLLPDRFAVTGGSMQFNGGDLLAMSASGRRALLGREIAFVPQEPLTALNPLWTIQQTFSEHLARLGVPARERFEVARRYLESVQLPVPAEMLLRYPHQLSGGQCQRVLIAMAFSSEPALLVADEPTTALDVITQTHIMRLLAEQQRRHATAVILITHDLRLAAHVCDKVAVMYAGDLVEFGPAHEVLRAPRHPYTRALKYATPGLTGERVMLPALSQQMPGLSAFAGMHGCRFAARCPSRNGACESTLIRRDDASGHSVACSEICEAATRAGGVEPAPEPPHPQPGQPVPVAELRNASLRYTSREGMFGQTKRHFDAVKNLSLKIYPGEFVGIVGESGSGKTSVARLLMGLEQATDGQVFIDGKQFARRDPAFLREAREKVQLIFQDPQSALNPRRAVERLLTQSFEASGMATLSDTERHSRAEAMQRDVGLPVDCLERFPSQLSGGQKQRVNIGRALCATPKLLVADEIVSGLDVSVQAQILNLLLRLGRERGVALLLISHDLSVVRYLCRRVLVMRRGEVVEAGLTEEVFANPQHPYTRSLIGAVPSDDANVAWPPASVEEAA